MNEFVVRFLWLTGQVTILSLAAAGLGAVLARRRPGAGAGVTLAGLGGLVVLTVAAALPVPVWWSWTRLLDGEGEAVSWLTELPPDDAAPGTAAPGGGGEAFAAPPQTASAAAESAATGWSLAGLRRLCGRFLPAIGGAASHQPLGGSFVLVLLSAGVCVGVTRLILGLYAVRRCRTNSMRLGDPTVLALLVILRREMACRRPVEVREATDVGGPVTVGWRHPVVLLPPPWRTWGAGELRAVLAHEVAHVRRADYAAWLLARFSVALHFYHPLAHWLAGRLHLQQELAADALGAWHAGGRRRYVQALARLALRQEEWLAAGPARAFLPVRGTLVRRIAMLRTEEMGDRRSWLRPLALVLLGLVVLGVSALRGPAHAGDEGAAPDREAKPRETPATPDPENAAAVQRPPFAYCVCVPEAAGFFGFRPSVCFGSDPRMKKYASEADKALAEVMKMTGGPETFPRLEEIEQVTGASS